MPAYRRLGLVELLLTDSPNTSQDSLKAFRVEGLGFQGFRVLGFQGFRVLGFECVRVLGC